MARLSITPELLRQAQRNLCAHDGTATGVTDYICHAVAYAVAPGGALRFQWIDASRDMGAWLRELDFLEASFNALSFTGVLPGDEFPPDEMRQGIRFMLLELLALALEDNAL